MQKKVLIVLSLLCFLGSCRYDEGSGTIPVKNRIRGQWKVNTVEKNGIATTTESPSLAESRNNLFDFYINQRLQINYIEDGTMYQGDGFYKFSSNKKELILDFSDKYRTYNRTYEILKFKNKELKVKFTDEENREWILEFTLIQSYIQYGM
jgi:hypothetical protein